MGFVKLTKAGTKKSGYVVGQVEDDTNKLYYLDKDGNVGELGNAVVFSSKEEALKAAKKSLCSAISD